MAAPYSLLVFSDEAEEAVILVRDSRREIDSITERKKIPQTIELERCPIGGAERFEKRPGRGIVIIDPPVTKIADPKFAIHQRESPRSIEKTI
jgi:hypothetical protein